MARNSTHGKKRQKLEVEHNTHKLGNMEIKGCRVQQFSMRIKMKYISFSDQKIIETSVCLFLCLFQHGYFPGDDIKIVKHHNTIGGFYNHILNALGYLTDCGRNNSIFTGDKGRQVDFSEWSVHGHTIKVYDYFTAVEAIQDIIDQGEGSSPCNPVAWDSGSKKYLSHYFLFYSVAEKHEIEVVETVLPPDDSGDKTVVDYTKV